MQLWKMLQWHLGPALDNSILWETSDLKYLKDDNSNKISILVSPEKIVMEMSGLVGFNDLEWNNDNTFINISPEKTYNYTVSRKRRNKINTIYSFTTPIWGKIKIPGMIWLNDYYNSSYSGVESEVQQYLYLTKFPGETEDTSSYYDIPLVNNISGNYFNWGIFCGLESLYTENNESEILEVITFPSEYDQYGESVNEVKPSFIRENNPDKNFGHPDDVPYGRYTYYDWKHKEFIPSIYIDVYPVEV
jgi:hypothetical protein